MINHNVVEDLTIVSTQLMRLSQDLESPMSDRILELKSKIWYILEIIKAEENILYKSQKTLLPPTNNQYIFPIPATVRDLLKLTKTSRDILIVVHENNKGDRRVVIRLIH